MRSRWLTPLVAVCFGLAMATSVRTASEAALFRLFLTDGTTLVSYGEFARVGDRVVFSMPMAATPDPPLQLVNIPADRVDWDRTERYLNAARATQYVATRAEDDYAALTNEVARTLNDVATTGDASKRLAAAEAARKTLAAWPADHFNYRLDDVRQMLVLLDEAIAGLRSAAGGGHFDLSLVAYSDPPVFAEPLLPPPTPREAIEQTLNAARLVDSPAERTSLLSAVVLAIDRDKDGLPADWAKVTRDSATGQIESEVATDRAYEQLRQEITSDLKAHAKAADVYGVQRIAATLAARDAELGGRRPDVVSGILETVNSELDAARRLRLARDRWALQLPALRRYRTAMQDPINLFLSLRPSLENIKALAGSAPGALSSIHARASEIQRETRGLKPPDDLRAAHALLVSAVQMADRAAELRLEATLAGDMARAWDASSAAAGALMLGAEARSRMQVAFKRPELP